MGDADGPHFTTLAERIAALNQQKNFHAPVPSGKRPPPPPPRPVARAATETTTTSTSTQPSSSVKPPPLPPQPTRVSTERQPPPLPRRSVDHEDSQLPSAPSPGRPPPLPARNTQQHTPQSLPPRKGSNASDVSLVSAVSSFSLNSTHSTTHEPPRRLPPRFDQSKIPPLPPKRTSEAKSKESETPEQRPRVLAPTLDQARLPPLPPSRRELEAKAKEQEAAEQQKAHTTPPLPPRRSTDSMKPVQPPPLPSRNGHPSPTTQPQESASAPTLPARRPLFKSALECGLSSGRKFPIQKPASTEPPPIPLASRPSAELPPLPLASRPSADSPPLPSNRPGVASSCLICRDFTLPDALAAANPTSSIPPHVDPIVHLAHVLCDPLPSLTDKARAIFTWCHHNIVYDVHNFLNHTVQYGLTPQQTIASGKAVCEGFARVYESIARQAGLECEVITGHGKGYGFSEIRPGDPIPRKDPTGHAWNVVRIDGGEYKLIDACWGAGHFKSCTNRYEQVFSPEWFTMSNERFGWKHFPEREGKYWFGVPKTWEEYILGPGGRDASEKAQVMGDAAREGLDDEGFVPRGKYISLSQEQVKAQSTGGLMRFLFAKVCPHWDSEKHGRGKQMLFLLKLGRYDGKDLRPVVYDGVWYFIDVPVQELGLPGQNVELVGLTMFDGRDARGLTKEEFASRFGRCAYAWTVLVRWELVA